jgi:hypothetical protein
MRGVCLALLGVSLVSACGGEEARSSADGQEKKKRPDATCAPGDYVDPRSFGYEPWTSRPQADWVQQVAERAGHRISGKTGSALIARGRGQDFYIWATKVVSAGEVGKTAERENWRRLGTVEGVDVYGDEALWRWWSAQGFIFWLHAGPQSTSRVPGLNHLDALVRASETVPLPC